jgi:tetratricopeptide (TPR) repeat protein
MAISTGTGDAHRLLELARELRWDFPPLAARARELTHGLEPALEQAPLHLHAQATRLAGDYEAAAELFRESLALNRRVGDAGMVAVELHNLGHVELHRGKVCAAAELFAECETVETGDESCSRALALLNRAAVASASGEQERARELVADIESTLDEAGVALAPDDAFELDWLRSRLG